MTDDPAAPIELRNVLGKNKAAARMFAGLAASHRREYVKWVMEGKKAETRERRARKVVEMILKKEA